MYGVLFLVKSFAFIGLVETQNIQDKITEFEYQKLAVCSAAMLIIGLIDLLYFKYYPMEAGLFIEVSGRSGQDL